MTYHGHNITHCVHGTIVSQCRCPIKDKPSVVVECPADCDARRVHLAEPDELLCRVEKQLYAMRNDGWDLRSFTDLVAEVRELRDLAGRRAAVLRFFRSVIQCGEPWTERCQIEFDAAMAEAKERGEGGMARTEAVIEFENDEGERLRVECGDEHFTFTARATTAVSVHFDDIDELVSFLLAMKG